MSTTNRLTALAAKSLGIGFHNDGAGLYLRVSDRRKSWVYVYQWKSRRREMGLGSFSDTSLAEARIKCSAARALVKSGVDPLAKSDQQSSAPSFSAMAEEFIALKGCGWRNEKHRQQWTNTLKDYAKPIADKPVDAITTEDVLACLVPIWKQKPETASRVRMRIENILDAAKARGHRSGENPATWKGNLAHLLPARSKLSRGHQRALHYDDVPAFVQRLRQRQGVAAKALEFTMLNAVRTSETLNATWSEFDLDAKVWTIPASRTKTSTQLRVPLSDDALSILHEMRGLGSDWVFPATSLKGPLSINSMRSVLIRMGTGEQATVHGFRSSFRDWAGETTDFPRDIVEMCLGHAVGSAVERAYRRGDALDRRRAVMEGWAAFIR
ncbi:phage integrase central domain-containing protein [Brevundimonas sp.]|uniref:tyrosine-type recombinase/integrase n=1 Tax=Brevundimonas sp. TaxID=1871086 RepID=UPI0028A07204|nr:integrase arm-type DNA-binding domain-containing protein [Brevundimonas sp.]